MAYYTAQGWKGTNLTLTDFRHSGNNPYRAEEYASAYPERKTDYDENYGRTDRKTTGSIYVKLDSNNKVIDYGKGCKDGSKYKCLNNFGVGGSFTNDGYGLNNWSDSRNFKWK